MIHVATVHHAREEWIEVQHRYLNRFIDEPFTFWGSLQEIDRSYRRYFDRLVPSRGNHAGRLNLLGRVICDEAAPDDLIFFLDGDAFPVADPVAPVRALLGDHALVAVQRLENEGDRQPHPCFCAVPVSVWRELRGDWSSGHPIRRNRTDVGANLLYALESTGTPWAPLRRSNRVDLHPVLFGIYGGFLYHHGAGFRKKKTTLGDPGKAEGIVVSDIQQRSRHNSSLSRKVRADLDADPDFFQQFL